MISGIVGKPGHGKSLEMTRIGCVAHDDKRVRCHIYANYLLNLERFTLVSPDGKQEGTIALASVRAGECGCEPACERAVVLLDEVHLWLPARRSLQLPTTWLALFSQTRKMGWDLWWTAQHETRVDKMLRDVTSFMYLAHGWGWPLEFYQYDKYEPEHFRKKGARIKRVTRRRSRRASLAYDTKGTIQGATHTQDKRDPYSGVKVTPGSGAGRSDEGAPPARELQGEKGRERERV